MQPTRIAIEVRRVPRREGVRPRRVPRDAASESILVERCRRGDREALEEFYAVYRADVTRSLRHLLGPARGDLDDLVQDVFVEVLRGIRGFRGESRVTTWLYRIAMNLTLQRLRRRSLNSEILGQDVPEGVDDLTPQRTLETRQRVERKIQAKHEDRLVERQAHHKRDLHQHRRDRAKDNQPSLLSQHKTASRHNHREKHEQQICHNSA